MSKISKYIKQNKKKGFSDEQIKKALLDTGWKQEDIDLSFGLVGEVKKQTKKPGPKWLIPVIVLIGIILIAGIVVAFNFDTVKGWFTKSEDQLEEEFEPLEEEPELCVDKCGDGTCDEIVCQAIDCPCSETIQSCPEDCEEDEFENWETYINEEYGYEVKYPEDWHQVNPFSELVSIGSDKPPYEDNYHGGMSGPSGTIIDFWTVTKDTPFISGREEISKEPITIDSVKGEKIISQNYYENNLDDAKIEKITEIFLKKDNLEYYIRVNFPNKSTQEKHITIFNQILSTFKFID